MSATAKTIQIFLPGGDPRGIRVAEVTTRIVQVIEVPRSLLTDFVKMDESGQVAVYFLVSEAIEESAPRVYVGQSKGQWVGRVEERFREDPAPGDSCGGC